MTDQARQGDGGGDSTPENLVYLSLNPLEAQDESEQLRAALHERGIPVYVRSHGRSSCDSEAMAEIATNLAQCTLAVVMGTAGYGEHTKAPLSTFDELQFIKCNKADYSCYFVRMCERFLEPVRKCRKAHQRHLSTTTLLLAPHSCSAHRAWTVGKRIPMGLVDDIVDALTRAAEMGQRLE